MGGHIVSAIHHAPLRKGFSDMIRHIRDTCDVRFSRGRVLRCDSAGGPATIVYKGTVDSANAMSGTVNAVEFAVEASSGAPGRSNRRSRAALRRRKQD